MINTVVLSRQKNLVVNNNSSRTTYTMKYYEVSIL
jgi:hypothetical protein